MNVRSPSQLHEVAWHTSEGTPMKTNPHASPRKAQIRPLVLALCAWCLFASQAMSQTDYVKAADGTQTKVLGLVFQVEDIGGKVEDVGGKVADLAVKETPLEIRIDLAADVLFDFDKSTLLPKARQTLHKAAGIIQDKAKGAVRIEGYTDAKGSDAYNQKLSERRANSVKDWFVDKEGLHKVHFTTQGFGPKNPVAPNKKADGSDDPAGRQKNRRVVIIITK
jgi:outer membrane protein OmpA-like peptidoglycan-associated protein